MENKATSLNTLVLDRCSSSQFYNFLIRGSYKRYKIIANKNVFYFRTMLTIVRTVILAKKNIYFLVYNALLYQQIVKISKMCSGTLSPTIWPKSWLSGNYTNVQLCFHQVGGRRFYFAPDNRLRKRKKNLGIRTYPIVHTPDVVVLCLTAGKIPNAYKAFMREFASLETFVLLPGTPNYAAHSFRANCFYICNLDDEYVVNYVFFSLIQLMKCH